MGSCRGLRSERVTESENASFQPTKTDDGGTERGGNFFCSQRGQVSDGREMDLIKSEKVFFSSIFSFQQIQ